MGKIRAIWEDLIIIGLFALAGGLFSALGLYFVKESVQSWYEVNILLERGVETQAILPGVSNTMCPLGAGVLAVMSGIVCCIISCRTAVSIRSGIPQACFAIREASVKRDPLAFA